MSVFAMSETDLGSSEELKLAFDETYTVNALNSNESAADRSPSPSKKASPAKKASPVKKAKTPAKSRRYENLYVIPLK